MAELSAGSIQEHHAPTQTTDIVAQLSGAHGIQAEHQTQAGRVRQTRALAAFLPDDRGVLAFLACLLGCHWGRSRQLTILRVFSYFCCCGWYRADSTPGLQELGGL